MPNSSSALSSWKQRSTGSLLETKIDRLAVELRAEMQVGFARMDQQFAQFEATLTKRMFVFWIGQAATTVGLVFGVVKLLH